MNSIAQKLSINFFRSQYFYSEEMERDYLIHLGTCSFSSVIFYNDHTPTNWIDSEIQSKKPWKCRMLPRKSVGLCDPLYQVESQIPETTSKIF